MQTVTHTSLLEGIRSRNNDHAWSEFFARYQPMIIAFSRKLGLSDQDAQDAAQEALLTFVKSYQEGGYDRDKGRLRNWLFGIAAHKIQHQQRREGKHVVVGDDHSGTRFIERVADDRTMSEIWEAEWARAVLAQAMHEVRRQVKPQTMEAFELFALKGWPAQKVAQKLGITENAVWIAKNRVMSRLRKAQEFLEANW